MPYIKKDERAELDKIADQISALMEKLPDKDRDGCLNYLFTKTLKAIYRPSYLNYERVMGLLECIQHEFYRRWIAPYEESKMREHGDVE
ncbi:MAG: hypothetical protein N3F10_02480 [Candidatus Bathyarchaeota archaeon]|nr:hypothetical protein [Candidatus Bathyarchaeota archaeon]MCX8177150.1 hypothetical protein [Candidatus Bathyarchaeota archaeon]MDW8193680.1 hypothetical protein [Nitrososphaerota archaeon]